VAGGGLISACRHHHSAAMREIAATRSQLKNRKIHLRISRWALGFYSLSFC